MKIKIFGLLLLLSIGIVIGGMASEIGFRFYLKNISPHKFVSETEDRPNVWFLQKSRWHFHKAHGYSYGPETVYGGTAVGGEVRSCWSWPANARGNMGLIEGSYDDADIKIAVFGDSFTAQIDTSTDDRGIAWPNFFQRKLQAALNKKVHVLNFGRDGTGILHMTDLAADMVTKWAPDTVVFAFITDDLTRARFWRTVTEYYGKERVVTTIVPEEHPPLEKSADTAIVHSAASKEWCENMVGSGRTDDPVLLEMEAIVNDAKQRLTGLADPYTLSTAYLYNQIIHNNAFHHMANLTPTSQNPRHQMKDFGEDQRFLENIKTIKASGVDIVLVHLAVYDELVSENEYKMNDHQRLLLESLESHLGTKAMGSIGVAEPEGGYATIKRAPNDAHPSLEGMKFYAEVARQAVME